MEIMGKSPKTMDPPRRLGDHCVGSMVAPHKKHRQQHFAYIAGTLAWIRCREHYIRCKQTGHLHYVETEDRATWFQIPDKATPAEFIQMTPTEWQCTHHTECMRPPPGRILRTFRDHISALDGWEVELLQHIEFSTDPRSAALALTYGIRAVSDGSAKFQTRGAFGWSISTDKGERIATGMGPARGARQHSYRAEAYGMLALYIFLHRLAEYTQTITPWKGIIATDSQSLLDTVLGIRQYTEVTSEAPLPRLDVLTPEWDILVQIQDFIKKCHT